jgi:hypothetical protein
MGPVRVLVGIFNLCYRGNYRAQFQDIFRLLKVKIRHLSGLINFKGNTCYTQAQPTASINTALINTALITIALSISAPSSTAVQHSSVHRQFHPPLHRPS